VIKEALITSALYNKHGEHLGLGEIFASTIGVIFLGTPHRGSSQESLAEIATNIARLSLRQPNKQLLATLSQESHILEVQRERFKTISSNFSIVCIREELPTGLGLVCLLSEKISWLLAFVNILMVDCQRSLCFLRW